MKINTLPKRLTTLTAESVFSLVYIYTRCLTKRRFAIWVILVVTGFVFGCDNKKNDDLSKEDVASFLSGRNFQVFEPALQVHDFEYQLISGGKEQFFNNRGQIIILNFWATWCFPCKKEMPDLEELNHEMKNETFRLIAVNSGDNRGKIERFLVKNPYSFDIILDEDMKISKMFNVVGLPTTFVLTNDLKIVGKIVGPIDWKEKTLIQFLKKLNSYRAL